MTELAWNEESSSLLAGAYCIRPIGEEGAGGWRLHIERRGLGWALEPEITEHRTLRAAKARAARHEAERAKRVRLQWHIGGACLAAIAWVAYVASGDRGFSGFLVWMGLWAATLRFGSNAVGVAIDDESDSGRGWFRVERWLRVESLVPPRSESSPAGSAVVETKVRVLSPWD